MNITMLEPSKLKNYEKNARTHSDEQIEQIIKSIKDYGFNVPVEVNPDFVILSGHARVMAATKMGLEKIPVVIHEHLTQESKQKGYILAANKIAMNAGWDDGILTDELRTLMDDPEFDMESTGFDLDELAAMFPPPEPIRFSDEDDVPEIPAEPKTKLGDIWVLGNHRLMCGDSTNIEAVDRLLAGEKADMVFTDPPYRMDVEGGSNQIVGKAAAKLGEAIKHLCDFDPVKFLESLPFVFANKMNAYVFCNKDLVPDYLNWAIQQKYSFNILFWKKPSAIPLGKQHRPDVEYLLVFRKKAHWNDGVKNVNYSKCLEYSRQSGLHPTMKPIELIANQLQISSPEYGKVFDFFGGSGSTLIACEKLNRKCFMMELDPIYCDVIVQRWENFTGKRAVLDSSCTGEG